MWEQHDEGRAVRLRPIDDVIKELVFLKDRYAIDGFHIVDDTFNVSKKRVIEFCDKLMDAKLDLIWGRQVRANLFDEELVRIAKRANCVQFEFGVESGSQRLLDKIKKRITVEQIKFAFSTCSKYGMRTFANILVNLPTETEQDVKETEQLMEEIRATVYGFGITVPYPGTALFNKYFATKILKENYPLFSDARVDRESFRMSQHKIDLEKVLDGWDRKFRYSVCNELFVSKEYRNRVLKSKRIGKYISTFVIKPFKSRINMRKMYKNYYGIYSVIARSGKFWRRPCRESCSS